MHQGLMALVTVILHVVSAQEKGASVLRQGETDIQSEIVTSRTKAFLSCESGDMVIRVNFTQPFRGLMYAHRSRNSPCKIHGTGGFYYELRIPLKGCGTWQASPRMFVNNITIRFHQALELEEDETKTVVCRYPPPLTPPPGSVHVTATSGPPRTVDPNKVRSASLSEVEILIIICLLLFLSLLTLGIGIAYFCLKKRNIHLVRKRHKGIASSGPASQLTKLSSSAGTQLHPSSVLSSALLDHTVRIPRAVPYSASLKATSSALHSISDHQYDYYENPAGTSTDSGESTETSPSTATTTDESVDGTKHLLHFRNGISSTLTIPKAVLRKDDKMRRTIPEVYPFLSKTSGVNFFRRRNGELEDQTITTVLEPESNNDDLSQTEIKRGLYDERPKAYSHDALRSIPIYAQIDKRKNKVRILGDVQVIHSEHFQAKDNKAHTKSRYYPGTARRQSTLYQKTHEIKSSFKQANQTTEKPNAKDSSESSYFSDRSSSEPIIWQGKNNLNAETCSKAISLELPFNNAEKNVYIQDINDVFVTTTVETKSTELRTSVSRDIIEKHVKNNCQNNKNKEIKELLKPAETNVQKQNKISNQISNLNKLIPIATEKHVSDVKSDIKDAVSPNNKIEKPSTHDWSVVIRQRQPPFLQTVPSETESKNNKESAENVKPQFDVKIRTILPKDLKPSYFRNKSQDRKQSTVLVDIPQLEMPQTVDALRGITTQTNLTTSSDTRSSSKDDNKHTEKVESDVKKYADEITTKQPKSVWWPDDISEMNTTLKSDKTTGSSSSGSFQSQESLRERSSSEVLEVAPTLFRRQSSDHPMLERSTSEIATPEKQFKWTENKPILESYSQEFLDSIPIVTQGGFFNSQVLPEKSEKFVHIEKSSSSDT